MARAVQFFVELFGLDPGGSCLMEARAAGCTAGCGAGVSERSGTRTFEPGAVRKLARRNEAQAAEAAPRPALRPAARAGGPHFLVDHLFSHLGPTGEASCEASCAPPDVKIQPRGRSQLDAAVVRVVGQMAIDIAGFFRADAR